ncbi:hypothetical protein FGO68_gene10611 [Halteria grandinella]|uniref:Uncharacterized protein n=1 Tax=Halteria grandinella TaxID=5974 RepID=A0A8J8NDQ4_HALGN|nr:hypothetical protein FGO68_gene10611 [Halteria grandinella]
MCMEHFVLGTAFQDLYEFYLTSGVKKLRLEFKEPHHRIDVLTNGLQIFSFCAGHSSILSSLLQTGSLFAGGFGASKFIPFVGSKIPEGMVKANVDYLEKFMGKTLEKRVIQKVKIDQSLIKDGDLLLIRRFDGIDPFYMVSSGSQAAHAAVLLWDNQTLYVHECQHAWYFQTGLSGVQRTPFDEWIALARDADQDVAWVQLRSDVRRRFNSTKALNFFHNKTGAPYSHRANFFSVVDTVEDNYFAPISSELLPFMVRYIQMIYPQVFDSVFREALNKRLGFHDEATQHFTFEDLLVDAVTVKNTTLEELVIIPENDTWVYSNLTDGYSASTFVAALYREAGLFDPKIEKEINVQEFTVRDLYQLDFFNTTGQRSRPSACQEADPHISYCQLMGQHRIVIGTGELASVKPYAHMNERCPTRGPEYLRPDNC